MSKTVSARIILSRLKRLAPGEKIWDTDIKGFGITAQARSMSYVLKTRIKGRQRWITIGRHGSPWTPELARKEALRLLAEIASGRDPVVERQQDRARLTIKQAAEKFLKEHVSKLRPSTQYEYQRLINKVIIPTFGKRKIDDFNRSDASRFHTSLGDKPRQANLTLAILSKFMGWAEQLGLRPENSNPCVGVKKYRENSKERYLSVEEVGRLGEILDQAEREQSETPFLIGAIRLLIVTGARLNEIKTLKWSYVDFEREVLNLPDSKTGQKLIKLSKAAIDELNKIPRVYQNPYVIVGHKTGHHLVNMQKPWQRIRSAAGLEDVRIHDLRHSFASFAVNSGASLPMIGALLGHTQTQTTARYAHLAEEPLLELNNEIGNMISGALKKRDK